MEEIYPEVCQCLFEISRKCLRCKSSALEDTYIGAEKGEIFHNFKSFQVVTKAREVVQSLHVKPAVRGQ